MALSQTDILNKSLTLIGANSITSINDDSQNARIANRIYEGALRAILSECKWNFATKRANLSVSADTLDWYDFGTNIVYDRPTDIIKIFGVNTIKGVWYEEQNYIISDTSPLGIRYVFYNNTPSTYPAVFITAFIDLLASDMAYAIVNSKTLAEKYKSLYEKVSLPKAISSNSQVGVQQGIMDDAWELAKYQDGQVNS